DPQIHHPHPGRRRRPGGWGGRGRVRGAGLRARPHRGRRAGARGLRPVPRPRHGARPRAP
ncbi:MAG: hypothetical protein AVDCRST_MAG13-1845, partial [uncultured Solirubrobacteraceae bacterium]